MSEYWRSEKTSQNILQVTFDSPDKEVNTLCEKAVLELDRIIDQIKADSNLKGVVFVSGKKDFIVGADIEEINKIKSVEEGIEASRALSEVFTRIESLKVPTVAAIHGQALGGGLELALACTWRVLTNDKSTQLGLPEIQLGLIPGAGGTQRLPRLIGLERSIDMILSAKKVSSKNAEKYGLADAVVPKDLLLTTAFEKALKRRPKGPIVDLRPGNLAKDLLTGAKEKNILGRKVMYRKAKEIVDEKTKGHYPASYKALDALFEGFDLSLAKGLELESNLFGQLVVTRESKSLIHLFHATNSLKKHKYKAFGREKFGHSKVQTVGIVGAGFMGAGIANVSLAKGKSVKISDPSKDSISRALRQCRDFFKKQVDRKKLKNFELQQKLAHLSPGLSLQGFSQCELVIEAVFEDLSLKKKILAQLEKNHHEDFIFATNTSAIPIKKIAEISQFPERVIGMHFFSPVEKMPLLEVIKTDKTAAWVIARVIEFGQEIGKQVIVVEDGPGFYTTRALSFYLNEAANLLAEGASIESIDQSLSDFGFPVGPITLIDEVGIDVGMHVLSTMQEAFSDRIGNPRGLAPIADSGRLGRKNNKGFYSYINGKKGSPDESIYQLIGVTKRDSELSEQVIVDRCLLQFVNESVRCLEEGVLSSPFDGDVGAVFGLGFPPVWGGPFKYIDHVGAPQVIERLRKLESKYGRRFKPCDYLEKVAREGRLFYPEEN
jgi:3-hydroxyacyl-CoA dehydrogenase/enoyl-CoA hydratase/3-hydroxybutyryl-CoA epimerase